MRVCCHLQLINAPPQYAAQMFKGANINGLSRTTSPETPTYIDTRSILTKPPLRVL